MTATANVITSAAEEQIPSVLFDENESQLSNWIDRAVEAFDANGEPNYLDANGELVEGIYLNMPNGLYHSLPAISSTKLKDFSKGAPYYKRKHIDEKDKELTETQKNAFLRGTLTHELVLEPDNFYSRYFRELNKEDYPNALFTAEDIKAALANAGLKVSGKKDDLIARLLAHDPDAQIFDHLVEQNRLKHGEPEEGDFEGETMMLYGGKRPIKSDAWDDAMRAAQTVRDEDQADLAIQNGLPEVTIIARCPQTGLMLKVKFDWLRFDDEAVDLKTTLSTDPSKFRRQFLDLKYDIQQAFYTYVASLVGINIKRFLFVAVEFLHQDVCIPFVRSPSCIKQGQEELHYYLPKFAQCLETNTWKSDYSGFIIELD